MDVILGSWNALGQRASSIRLSVFVNEQGVPLDIELDDNDDCSVHALAVDNLGVAIATGRLLPDAHIGRMAVLPAYRGQGVGSKILNALVNEARRQGHTSVVLSAQQHACAFYEAHGFVAEGYPYVDAGIDHILMRCRF